METIAGIREDIVDSEYYGLEELSEEEREAAIADFDRTKEKAIAAFLKARGFVFRGLEKVVLTNAQGRRKSVTQFCFDGKNVTRRHILEFYNTDDSKAHNVNAKLLLQEYRNVNSLIANF